jgi:ribonuclease P protein component
MKLSREARLSGAAQFRFVFSRPEVSRDAYFRVLSRPNGRGHSRLGMAVSLRVCRKAVGRNRLKRIVRESFRMHQIMLSDGCARDIVVLPSPAAATTCNRALFKSLWAHWRKIAPPGPEIDAGSAAIGT